MRKLHHCMAEGGVHTNGHAHVHVHVYAHVRLTQNQCTMHMRPSSRKHLQGRYNMKFPNLNSGGGGQSHLCVYHSAFSACTHTHTCTCTCTYMYVKCPPHPPPPAPHMKPCTCTCTCVCCPLMPSPSCMTHVHVFHASLKIFPSLSSCTCTCTLYMHMNITSGYVHVHVHNHFYNYFSIVGRTYMYMCIYRTYADTQATYGRMIHTVFIPPVCVGVLHSTSCNRKSVGSECVVTILGSGHVLLTAPHPSHHRSLLMTSLPVLHLTSSVEGSYMNPTWHMYSTCI